MTPPATAELPRMNERHQKERRDKRSYRDREVHARKCDVCGSKGRVGRTPAATDGSARWCYCTNDGCGNSWKQTPE